MTRSTVYLAVVLMSLFLPWTASAGSYAKLEELKKVCDAGFVPPEECVARRQRLLDQLEEESETSWFCNYTGEPTPPGLLLDPKTQKYSESASASAAVREIVDASGLVPNFVVRPSGVDNASATSRDGQRFVEFNPDFIALLKKSTGTNWAVYSVLAHEIGHHLQGHILQDVGSRPDLELEADEYSGFILAKLGSKLPEAQAALSTIVSETGSLTHPAKTQRLAAVKRGWEKAKKATPPPPAETAEPEPSPSEEEKPPKPVPPVSQPSPTYTDRCVIQGEPVVITSSNLVLSKIRGFLQVGQKLPAADPRCRFDIQATNGRYCVVATGQVFFGFPTPVGQCLPCTDNTCP